MKLKCTNVLVTIAMICSVLAMIMNWIIYFGPQDKYVQFFGVDVNNERIFDIRCIICPIPDCGTVYSCMHHHTEIAEEKNRIGDFSHCSCEPYYFKCIKCCMCGCSKPEICLFLWGVSAGESFDSE